MLVADKDRILSLDTVGFADVQAGKPMAADALFWVASQSKPITATAFMMLVDEGKVALDDPVEKYLPEFHDQWLAAEKTGDRMVLKKPAHPITIREILSHTSGLPFSSAAERPTLDLLPLRVGALTYAMTPCSSNQAASTPTRTRESIRPGESSRSSPTCRTRRSSPSVCSGRWG
jgi:CubicO group peptidase (beta-lactamase class C family)